MPGLPDEIRACLFDLDGVITQTAPVAVVEAVGLDGLFDVRVDGDVASERGLRGHERGAEVVVSDLAELLEAR